MLSVTHIMPILVLNTCMDANMQLTVNSFRQLFPDEIFTLTFSKIPDISLTPVKFPDIFRFSRQVVTLHISSHVYAIPFYFTLQFLTSWHNSNNSIIDAQHFDHFKQKSKISLKACCLLHHITVLVEVSYSCRSAKFEN